MKKIENLISHILWQVRDVSGFADDSRCDTRQARRIWRTWQWGNWHRCCRSNRWTWAPWRAWARSSTDRAWTWAPATATDRLDSCERVDGTTRPTSCRRGAGLWARECSRDRPFLRRHPVTSLSDVPRVEWSWLRARQLAASVAPGMSMDERSCFVEELRESP